MKAMGRAVDNGTRRVSVMITPRAHPDRPERLADVYEACIEDAVYAEELGFDVVWVGEHHFSRDQWVPAPLVFLAAVARATTRIRLGTAVRLLPLAHPIRVAESAIVVDQLSRGRLELGMGSGGSAEEFRVFGIDLNTRRTRALEAAHVIDQCFHSEESFSHEGRFFAYSDVDFTTRPAQPRVPLWWGGASPPGVTTAATRGYHLLPISPVYDEALVAAGRDPAEHHQGGFPNLVCVGETSDEAWDACQDGVDWTIRFYRERGLLRIPASDAGPFDRLPRPGRLRDVKGLGLHSPQNPILVGTPAEVTERWLESIAGQRVTQVTAWFRLPGMTTASVRRSMKLFADECMPVLRQASPG